MDLSDDVDSSDASSIIDISLLAPNNPALQETLAVAAASKEEISKQPHTTNNNDNSKEKEKSDDKEQAPSKTVRLVFGKSIRRWQAQQHQHRNTDSKKTSLAMESDGSLDELVLIRQQQANTTAGGVTLDKSSKITSLVPNDKLQLRTAHNGSSNCYYQGKLKKGGIPPMLDCLGFWDATQHAYILEIPDYIATDLAPMSTASSTSKTDHDHLTKNDPLEQLRQAELKIRKRKTASASASTNPTRAKKRTPKRTSDNKKDVKPAK